MPALGKLNDDVLKIIFKFFTRKELVPIAKVSKRFYKIAFDCFWSSKLIPGTLLQMNKENLSPKEFYQQHPWARIVEGPLKDISNNLRIYYVIGNRIKVKKQANIPREKLLASFFGKEKNKVNEFMLAYNDMCGIKRVARKKLFNDYHEKKNICYPLFTVLVDKKRNIFTDEKYAVQAHKDISGKYTYVFRIPMDYVCEIYSVTYEINSGIKLIRHEEKLNLHLPLQQTEKNQNKCLVM